MGKPEQRVTEIIEKLRIRGYRITPQRSEILRILTESDIHPSVEQVYKQVKTAFPMTSLATVYKTVEMLKAEGEILELAFANGSSRYDGNKPYPHPHLICIKCQNIIDPEVGLLEELSQEISAQYGYKIVSHRLDFFGVCPQCLSNQG